MAMPAGIFTVSARSVSLRVSRLDHVYAFHASTDGSSWQLVRVFTLGYINPRKIVAVEVRSALESASRIINSSLWWMTIQTSLRLAFGLSLWTSYALLHA